MIMYFVTDLNPKDGDMLHIADVDTILVSYWVLQGGKSPAKMEKYDDHLYGRTEPSITTVAPGEVRKNEG